MKKIIAFFRDITRKWKAETPKIAKCIRNIAAAITSCFPTCYTLIASNAITMPPWFSSWVGYTLFAASFITMVAAGTREK